jgi:hypothetical protein
VGGEDQLRTRELRHRLGRRMPRPAFVGSEQHGYRQPLARPPPQRLDTLVAPGRTRGGAIGSPAGSRWRTAIQRQSHAFARHSHCLIVANNRDFVKKLA